MEMLIPFLYLLTPLSLLIGGGLIGRYLEQKHFADLDRRERLVAHIVLSDLKTVPPGMEVLSGQLVTGSMVVAADYFKSFASSLKTLIGGRMNSLERMQERARREAVLRMVEAAQGLGAKAVMNVRLETSVIAGKGRGNCAGVEMLASGTALLG